MDDKLTIIRKNIGNERNEEFHALFYLMKSSDVDEKIAQAMMDVYQSAKEMRTRNQCLKLLFDKNFGFLRAFFEHAYKKSRHLDMKMNALRGLSQFVTEPEIRELLLGFNKILRKRPEHTPYNYQEYELLRGQHALPYLIKRYGYECFNETLEIVNSQYIAMPDAFKGHFTTDEAGKIVSLRPTAEAGRMMTDFFKSDPKFV